MALYTEMINVTEVKEIAIVNSNIDTAYLDQYVLYSQRFYIRKFLGNEFYEELLDQIENTTLTPDNTNVLVYIKDALAHYIVYEGLPQIRNQISKGGIFNNLNATSEPASDLSFGNTRQDYLMKAERFREEITFYIEDIRNDTPTAYPLYCGKSEQTGGIIFY